MLNASLNFPSGISYRFHCDYPHCGQATDSTYDGDGLLDAMYETGGWLLMPDDNGQIKGFCPAHMRHDEHGRAVEYDEKNIWDAALMPDDPMLIAYYEYGGCTYPLPLRECEQPILATLRGGRSK